MYFLLIAVISTPPAFLQLQLYHESHQEADDKIRKIFKVVENTYHNNEVTDKYMDKRRFTIDQNCAEVLLRKEMMV